MKESNKTFLLLVLVYTCQVLMSYSVSWNILEKSSNKMPLAICLSISAIIPYALQTCSSKLNEYIKTNTKKILISIIMSGILICMCFLFLDYKKLIINYILMAFTSIIFFILTEVVEYIISLEVLSKKRTSDEASKVINIASNTAGLIGAFINGVFMQIEGVKTVVMLNVLLFIVILLITANLKDTEYNSQEEKIIEDIGGKSINKKLIGVYCLFVLLAVSTVSTNILLMELLQNELGWNVMQYGIIDALAGIGAVAGIYMLNNKILKNISRINVIGLFIVFIGISINKNFIIMAIILFLWGVFMSTFSVEGREVVFRVCSNRNESQQVTKQLIWIRTITNAIAPLVIGIIFIDVKASISMTIVGLFLFIALTVVKFSNNNTSVKV